MKQRDGPDIVEEMKHSYAMVITALVLLARPIEVWVFKPGTVGERRFSGIDGMLALFTMPVLLVCVDPREAWPFALCGLMYPAGLVVHRLANALRSRRGVPCHSMEIGRPRTRWWECIGWVGVFMMALSASPPFAFYLTAALLSLCVQQAIVKAKVNAVLRARQDAELEHEFYSQTFDERRR